MKKLIAVLSLVLFFSSCSTNNTTKTMHNKITICDNTINTELIVLSQNPTSESMPQTIYFNNLSEYSNLITALDLPDDEFIQYLDEMNYSMNGLETKEDAMLLVEKLNKIPLPIIEDVQKVSLVIAYETEILTVKQKNSADNLYSVRLSLSSDEKFISDNMKRIHEMNTLNNIADNQNVLFYTSINNQHVYEGYIDGNLIDFRGINSTKSESDEAVASISFTSLPELCKESLQIKSQAQNENSRKNFYAGENQVKSITKEPPRLRRL